MKCLVLCNGQPPPRAVFEETLQWADLFIAADGGANVGQKFGALADVVIGDMDSYEPIDRFQGEVIHDPDQYSNDLEKALELAAKKDIQSVKVLGATGLRLDHTLKNLSVLKQFDDRFKDIVLVDGQGVVKLLPHTFSENLPVGTAVSLFPLSGKVSGITTRGLKYELNQDFLENGVRDGSSNTVVAKPVEIQHQKGDLLLFIAR